ncbi:NTP transferase domain-containing protein [Paenibacillus solisilvae]|uniref:NTP transferase domain-containing protein n=1 Tax=Paenibacillus solisilvae TaxID=2486751 RepID=A0ABW0VUA1_9BACL
MGEAKLPLELSPGITLGSRGLRELRACGLSSLTVVVRQEDPLLWVYDRRDLGSRLSKVKIVPCKEAHLGMSHSIRSGLDALLPESPDAVLVALADQPFVTQALLKRLISVYLKDPTVDYVASGQGEASVPPVILSKSIFPVLTELQGDAGARHIFHSPEFKGTRVRYAAEWAFVDVDTPDEMEKARLIWSELQLKAR